MSERINTFHTVKNTARKCGVSGLELRAVVDAMIYVTKNQPHPVDVEKARKKIVKIINGVIQEEK